MLKLAAVLVGILLCTANAFAVNKCTGSDGKISFQDAPCAGKGGAITVTPATGTANTNTAAASPISTQAETLKSERIRREKWIAMNYARNAVINARRDCETQQRELASGKVLSRNNLAGATRDQSISQEMTAAAIACDSRVRSLEKEQADSEKVCSEIKCIAVF
jgi:hypothetical protein